MPSFVRSYLNAEHINATQPAFSLHGFCSEAAQTGVDAALISDPRFLIETRILQFGLRNLKIENLESGI